MKDAGLWALLAPVLVAMVTGGFALWQRQTRQARRIDVATARKTEAETKSVEVQTAHTLIEMLQTQYEQLRADRDKDRVDAAEQHGSMRVEIDNLRGTQRRIERQLTTLLGQLLMHQPWDQAAYKALVAHDGQFPPPPPIDTPDDLTP